MGKLMISDEDEVKIVLRVVVNQSQSLIWQFPHQLVLSVIIPLEGDARPTQHVFLK